MGKGNMTSNFEDYLNDRFMEMFPMTLDDDLPDAFNDYEWATEELIEHADNFAQLQFLTGQKKGLEDARVIMKGTYGTNS